MVNVAHTTVGLLILFVFGVSLLNPGGGKVALLIALIFVAALFFFPFVGEYVLSVNKGKKARKKPDMSQQDNDGGTQK